MDRDSIDSKFVKNKHVAIQLKTELIFILFIIVVSLISDCNTYVSMDCISKL